jgi:hypothetical protein
MPLTLTNEEWTSLPTPPSTRGLTDPDRHPRSPWDWGMPSGAPVGQKHAIMVLQDRFWRAENMSF